MRLSAEAGMVGMPTGPEAGRREPVREERKGEKKTQNTPVHPTASTHTMTYMKSHEICFFICDFKFIHAMSISTCELKQN